jgi:hypothetical protein
MCRGVVYLISFDNTNGIYIGKTCNKVNDRFTYHKNNPKSAVYQYIKKNPSINNVYLDIIDSTPLGLIKYDDGYEIYGCQNLECLERFHYHNYISEGIYDVINKQIYSYDLNEYKIIYSKKINKIFLYNIPSIECI